VLNVLGERQVVTTYAYFDNGEPRIASTTIYSQASSGVACTSEQTIKEVVIDALGRPIQALVNQELFADVAYDPRGRIGSIALSDGSVIVERYDDYTLANVGVDRMLADGRVLSSSVSFSNRGLVDRERMDSPAGPVERVYGYTAQGFLQTATDNGAQAYSYSFDAHTGLSSTLSQLASSGYSFDALGRLTTRAPAGDTSVSYHYGLDGQIHDVCDGTGPCVATGATAHFIYDESGPRLATVGPTGSLLLAYTNDGVLEQPKQLPDGTVDPGGLDAPMSIAGTHVGTLKRGAFQALATDLRGTNLGTTATQRPSPFGARIAQSSSASTTSFIVQPLDPHTKLTRLGVRDYEPATGMFAQPDGLYLGDPNNLIADHVGGNLYSYGANNPVMFVDRNGQFVDALIAGLYYLLSLGAEALGSALSSGGHGVYVGGGVVADQSGISSPGVTAGEPSDNTYVTLGAVQGGVASSLAYSVSQIAARQGDQILYNGPSYAVYGGLQAVAAVQDELDPTGEHAFAALGLTVMTPSPIDDAVVGALWGSQRLRLAFAARAGGGAFSRILSFTERAAQKGFTKHGADFGLSGNWNPARAAEYRSTINQFINRPGVQTITGSYRGNPAVHYVDPTSGLNVVSDLSGNYVSAWRLGVEQLQSVLSTGWLW
jgi:RHS repeat-associated protein